MICSLEELSAKEVIDVKTGERLGMIDDLRLNTETSEVTALLIYGGYRFFGILGRERDTEIPCSAVKVIGRDTVLVDGSLLTYSTNRKRNFLGSLFD
ncbi:MAG: YlmC/YmxH family sporulation protein [Alistipes sp.]|nr:YlmC/YmxH family sporulation protein [Alistipes sp.]